MKNHETKTKSKTTLGVARHLFSRAVCLGAVVLICSSAPAQNLFVADGYSNTGNIYKFTPDGVLTTFASGSGSLACDSTGNVFVSDYGNGVMPKSGIGNGAIYKFTPAGVRSTFASGLNGPTALAFDSAGDLFVSEDE